MSVPLQGLDDVQFLLRLHPGEDPGTAGEPVHGGGVYCQPQFRTGDDLFGGVRQFQFPGDGQGGGGVIACDHTHLNARFPAIHHGGFSLSA